MDTFLLMRIQSTPIKSRLVTFILTKFLLNKLKLHVNWLQITNHDNYTIIIQRRFLPETNSVV